MASPLINPSPTLNASERVKALIHRLHANSLAQEAELNKPDGELSKLKALNEQGAAGDANAQGDFQQQFDDLMRDKMIALEQDKALFVYHICRTISATRVVEAGTSFGLSTIYLALAVGQNAVKLDPEQRKAAKVIATEYEPSKIALARQHWQEAGDEVEPWIELREGDLRQTLASDLPAEIDFVLFDIWTPMVLPTLRLLESNLKKGAVIVADNVTSAADGYEDYHNYIETHRNAYRTLVLPYSGGLELTVYDP
ncbi:O-methyltransferase [Xylaria bambusicola]|uniref:O-methyltransferase n=1 Tax=Xylaria bambusicola TaxID=326684 RepID=UPI002008B13F|nr:O-methyltransferase [Xylaria bambusicola]KAI0506918.1 O-methyltransferase [Xylaria bambusicola]